MFRICFIVEIYMTDNKIKACMNFMLLRELQNYLQNVAKLLVLLLQI